MISLLNKLARFLYNNLDDMVTMTFSSDQYKLL